MAKLILHGHYHTLNFGDLLIADLIASGLRKRYNVRPTIPWVHRATRGRLAAESGRGLRSCLGARAAIFGGGGYLETGGTKRFAALLPMLIPAAYWRCKGCKYVMVGVGVGPRVLEAQAWRIAAICRWAQAVSVRDEESRDLLVRIGVPADSVEVTADWVLGMERSDLPAAAADWAVQTLGSRAEGEIRLGLHVQQGLTDADLLERVARQVARGLAGRDHVTTWWFFDQYPSDLTAFRRIVQQHLPRSTIIPADDHWRTAALIGQFDAVLTTKLHVGIAAFALGVAPCAYARHSKVVRFYEQIRRTEYHAHADEPADRISEWARQLADDPSAFTALDSDRREAMRALARRNEEIIDGALGRLLHELRES